jgi:light-regulated signal transduction histidine kinase (bacteriophytochrome)
MHLKSLKIFCDVVSRKSFSKAAEDNAISQSGVSQVINQLEQRVNERTAQLQATNRELDAFAYSVSHDLRAPLRAVEGFSHVLLDDYGDKLDDTGKDYLKRIQAGSVRMAKLIDALLKLSRITRSELAITPVRIGEMAAEIARELQGAEPDRDVEFRINKEIIALADETMMKAVMENLLNNAWKFTRKTAQAKIEFGVISEGACPVYFVRDNGVGFSMEFESRLFGAFQRLHRHDEFEGTGIGLATVQRIIILHGGRIWAEGEEGKGATFYFSLGDMAL